MCWVLPAKYLVEYELDVIDLKENIVAFEHFLQIAIAKLSDKIDVIKIIDSLVFRDENLDHPDDIRMLTILQ